MKIVHLIWAFPIGGAETMLVEIMNVQCLENDVVLVIINDLINEELINEINAKVKIIRIKRPTGSRNYFYYLKAWLSLFLENAKVIHCHNANLSRFLKGIRSKSCLTVHSVKFDTEYLRDYNRIYAISKKVKSAILQKTNLNSILIYNGINIANYKQKKMLSTDDFKILQISRLEHDHKGQDILINAVNFLVKKNHIKNIQLDFIGKGSSKDFLIKLVNKLDIASKVNFLGEKKKDEIGEELIKYHLLVQPSKFEGFGLTIVEAMVAKIPVLVSNIDGPIEIIHNGKYGSYFEVGSHIDCASKITDIINNYSMYSDQNRLDEIKQYATEKFDVKKTALRYVEEYNFLDT